MNDLWDLYTPLFDVRIHELEREILVEAKLPNVSENQIFVEHDRRILTIRVEDQKQMELKDENTNSYHFERHYGNVQRTILLPKEVRQFGTRVKFQNGNLTVRLLKR